jgi:hypothetical protein
MSNNETQHNKLINPNTTPITLCLRALLTYIIPALSMEPRRILLRSALALTATMIPSGTLMRPGNGTHREHTPQTKDTLARMLRTWPRCGSQSLRGPAGGICSE